LNSPLERPKEILNSPLERPKEILNSPLERPSEILNRAKETILGEKRPSRGGGGSGKRSRFGFRPKKPATVTQLLNVNVLTGTREEGVQEEEELYSSGDEIPAEQEQQRGEESQKGTPNCSLSNNESSPVKKAISRDNPENL